MKRYRLNSTLYVKWKVIVNNYSYDNLTLFLIDPRHNKTKMSFYIEEDSIICFTFYGEDQKYSGKYSLSLIANYKESNQQIIDAIDVFTLVPFLDEEDDTVYIDTNDILTVGIQGDSAYQSWLNIGNEGSEKDFIDSLKMKWSDLSESDIEYFRQPAIDAANKLEDKVNSLIEEAKPVLEDLPDQVSANLTKVEAAISELDSVKDSVSDKLSDLDSKFSDLSDSLQNSFSSQSVTLSDKIDTNLQKLNLDANKAIQSTNKAVSDTESKVKQFEKDIKQSISDNKNSVSALTVKIDSKLYSIETKVDNEISEMKSTINSEISIIDTSLNNKLSALENKVDNITVPDVDLTEVNSSINKNKKSISDMKDKIDIFDSKVSNIQGQISDIKSAIDNLDIPETDLSEINNQIIILNNSLNSYSNQIKIINKQISNLDSKYTEIDNLVNSIDSCICDLTDIENELSYIKAKYESYENRILTLELKPGFELKFNEIFVRLCDIERKLLSKSSIELRLESLENRIKGDGTVSDYDDLEIRTEIASIKEQITALEATDVDTTTVNTKLADLEERLLFLENKEDRPCDLLNGLVTNLNTQVGSIVQTHQEDIQELIDITDELKAQIAILQEETGNNNGEYNIDNMFPVQYYGEPRLSSYSLPDNPDTSNYSPLEPTESGVGAISFNVDYIKPANVIEFNVKIDTPDQITKNGVIKISFNGYLSGNTDSSVTIYAAITFIEYKKISETHSIQKIRINIPNISETNNVIFCNNPDIITLHFIMTSDYEVQYETVSATDSTPLINFYNTEYPDGVLPDESETETTIEDLVSLYNMLRNRIIVLENKTDNDTVYNDSYVLSQINFLINRFEELDLDVYDDTEIKNSIIKIQAKLDILQQGIIDNNNQVKQTVNVLTQKVINLEKNLITDIEEEINVTINKVNENSDSIYNLTDTVNNNRIEYLDKTSKIENSISNIESEISKLHNYDDTDIRELISGLENRIQTIETSIISILNRLSILENEN